MNSIKLLHTSDWHLGQNFMGQSRQEEHEAFLAWLLNTIKDEQIEVLIVAGDIFDTGTPPNYALELYYNFLKELSGVKTLITTVITAGNHDSISTLKAPKLLLQALNVQVITSGDDSENEIIEIKKQNKLQAIICAVPFLRDSVIRESVWGQTISQKEKLANSGIKAYYENTYKKALKIRANENIPIIATGHLTTVGSRTSQSERDIYIGGTIDIGGDYLASMFDYVALGHLHINQIVKQEHVRYSGSPIPLSFSEAKNTQKVNIVSFTNSIKIKELEIPLLRKLIVLKGDLKSIIKQLKQIEDKTAWIEVQVSDDNPYIANQDIREEALNLKLTLLAVKIKKDEKQLRAKELKAISLDELSIDEVFEKKLNDEKLSDESLIKQLKKSFKEVVQIVHENKADQK